MFSKFIRFGVVLSGAIILSSCSSGSGQAETQQSTPEGLFEGQLTVNYSNSTGSSATASASTSPSVYVGPASCTQNVIMFVDYASAIYTFYTAPTAANPAAVIGASSGSLTFSGGTVGASGMIEVVPPNSIGESATAPNGTNCGVPITYTNEVINNVVQVDNATTSPTFTGAYNTGVNLAGTFSYPTAIDLAIDFKTSTFNINYDADYQNVQNLATLAGTYIGTVGTSQFSEAATFTFGPASVPANGGNSFGVGLVSGTGASGCAYSGTVSPLFKGNGYTMLVTSGGPPCQLSNQQFAGLVYLYTAQNTLYSFAPNQARNDGLIFTGVRQ